jgi:hypothetical protein
VLEAVKLLLDIGRTEPRERRILRSHISQPRRAMACGTRSDLRGYRCRSRRNCGHRNNGTRRDYSDQRSTHVRISPTSRDHGAVMTDLPDLIIRREAIKLIRRVDQF